MKKRILTLLPLLCAVMMCALLFGACSDNDADDRMSVPGVSSMPYVPPVSSVPVVPDVSDWDVSNDNDRDLSRLPGVNSGTVSPLPGTQSGVVSPNPNPTNPINPTTP